MWAGAGGRGQFTGRWRGHGCSPAKLAPRKTSPQSAGHISSSGCENQGRGVGEAQGLSARRWGRDSGRGHCPQLCVHMDGGRRDAGLQGPVGQCCVGLGGFGRKWFPSGRWELQCLRFGTRSVLGWVQNHPGPG